MSVLSVSSNGFSFGSTASTASNSSELIARQATDKKTFLQNAVSVSAGGVGNLLDIRA